MGSESVLTSHAKHGSSKRPAEWEGSVLSQITRLDRNQRNDTLAQCLQAAIRAPSAHNSQPWRFSIDDEAIRLVWDEQRRLPNGDPTGSYLAIGLGAVAESLSIALAANDVACDTRIEWDWDTRQAATIELARGSMPTADTNLASHIQQRRTTRLPFTDQRVGATDLDVLAADIERNGCALNVVQESRRLRAIADAIGEGTARNFANERVFTEFHKWLRSSENARSDGLTFDALELHGVRGTVARIALRPSSMGILRRTGIHRLIASEQTRLARSTRTFCLVIAPDSSPEGMFQAGRAIQRMWLRATALGLRVHPMTAALDHIETKRALADAFAISFDTPIAICFRIGHGPAGTPSRRLPLDQVVF